MQKINLIRSAYQQKSIDKPSFIREMYQQVHDVLFDYAQHLANTNIKKIEIEDGCVVMTTRNRGIRFACSPGDYRIGPIEALNFLDHERGELAMMERLIEDDHNFFDIGANIGWYSINIAASRGGGRGHIFCFEPIPKTFSQLKNNISINFVRNVTVCNFGFSNSLGEFTFYYYPEGSGNASSANVTERKDIEEVQCKVRTLDDYTAETGAHVDFIKCDVEGAELLVFQGGLETIKRDFPIVFSEILRKWSSKFNYNPNEIFDFFRRLNYRSFTLDGAFLKEFIGMDESTAETNFFFLHNEKHARKIQQMRLRTD